MHLTHDPSVTLLGIIQHSHHHAHGGVHPLQSHSIAKSDITQHALFQRHSWPVAEYNEMVQELGKLKLR